MTKDELCNALLDAGRATTLNGTICMVSQTLLREAICALRAPEAADAGAVALSPGLIGAMVSAMGRRARSYGEDSAWDDYRTVQKWADGYGKRSPTAAGIAAPLSGDHDLLALAVSDPDAYLAIANEALDRAGVPHRFRRFNKDEAAMALASRAAQPAASADAVRETFNEALQQYGDQPYSMRAINAAWDAALTAPVAGADAGMRERAAKVAEDAASLFPAEQFMMRANATGFGKRIAEAIRALPASGEADAAAVLMSDCGDENCGCTVGLPCPKPARS